MNGGAWGDDNTFKFVTGRTTYYNSLVTNRAMDYSLTDGISVRELLECGPMVHSLKNSSLSNHLGFNGFVESSDGSIMLVYRKKNCLHSETNVFRQCWSQFESKVCLG